MSIPLTTHATAEEDLYRDGEDDTRTVTIFNNAVEFCGFLKNKNPLLFQYMMQDCEEEVNEYGFAYREDIRVPDDEIWVLRNIRINFINPVPHFIVHGNGKLVIEGEHTRFRKTNGCAILIDFNMTSKNLFIKEGVFETEDDYGQKESDKDTFTYNLAEFIGVYKPNKSSESLKYWRLRLL